MTVILIACAVAAATTESLPEPVRPFLSAKAKDGTKVLSDKDVEKLAQMPERTRQLLAPRWKA